MREILFRGKDKRSGKWYFGYYHVTHGTPAIFKETEIDPREDYAFVDPSTVGQYTGLTDKNGRKIFEGDIVEGNSEYFTYTHPYGKVVYDGGQYLISFDDVLEDIECLGAWANDVEIIGNIYDNPELLEGS